MIKHSLIAVSLFGLAVMPMTAQAQSPADLNDLEIAHVAYTADLIDIRYAHLALAISKNLEVRSFAEGMIQDHSFVNDQALALLEKLDASPEDNFLSRQLNDQADQLVTEMSQLSGAAFDKRYADNELAYHKAVNDLLQGTFIPNLDNPEVKALFVDAGGIFEAHEGAAAQMVASVQVAAVQ